MTLMEAPDKSSLRKRVRETLGTITREERKSFSVALREVFRQQTIWREARRVLFYAGLPDEPDLTALLEAGWREGKSIALPRYDSAGGQYSAAVICSAADLAPGRFGVLEPNAGCPLIPLNQLDLVFVPGVAFDFTGRRLGRGKGFYDRLLAEVRGHKCGVAFDQQIVAAVPEEPHDIRVNSILTPTQWRLCQSAA
jgi:5-formyltetrahydrofolate cyclo-ligase